MMTEGMNIHVFLPGEAEHRVLHEARVVAEPDSGGSGFVIELAETGLAARPGTHAVVYFEHNREFMQQAVRIDAILEREPKLTLAIEPTEDAASAETRQCFRVSTVRSGLTAILDATYEMEVVDVSATGFAVVGDRDHPELPQGRIVTAILNHDDVQCTGRACVQSVRYVGKKRIRYGLQCCDTSAMAGLARGLQKISMEIQRQQLRRLAGAG